MTPQRAFSYIRYSTPEQAQGDSIRRQLDASRRYAQERGFALDESLQPDRGISAFKGKNRTQGNLGAFLADCRSGRVSKGSALLVESLDRLSREEVEEALYQFLDIIRIGIEIHTLADGAVYKKGHLRTEQLMISLFVMARANEESLRKSERIGSAWRQKKRRAAESLGIAITARVPSWIKAETGKTMELIPERAEVVREIFKMAGAGIGAQIIAQKLNADSRRYPFFSQHEYEGKGKRWIKSRVEKILRHPATFGGFQPKTKTLTGKLEPDGDLVHDFYPAVITLAEFKAVQTARASRIRKHKGSSTAEMSNLFAGIVYDATLKLPMNYQRWKQRKLLVTASYQFKIKPNKISYSDFEKAFLRFLDQLDWTTVLDVAESEELQKCEKEIATLTAEIALGEQDVKRLNDALAQYPTKGIHERALAAEAKLDNDQTARTAAEHRLEHLRQQNRELLDDSVAYAKLAKATDLQTRARLREEIRRKVRKISLRFEGATSVLIEFTNGATRYLRFAGAKLVAVGSAEEEEGGWVRHEFHVQGGVTTDDIIEMVERTKE